MNVPDRSIKSAAIETPIRHLIIDGLLSRESWVSVHVWKNPADEESFI